MKITIIHSYFEVLGGAQIWIQEVANRLVNRGHEVSIIGTTIDSRIFTFDNRVKIFSLGRYNAKHPLYWVTMPRIIDLGQKILKKINPDVINAHHFPSYISAYRFNPKKTFWYCHEPYPYFYDQIYVRKENRLVFYSSLGLRTVYRPLDIKYARKIRTIVTNSNYSKEMILHTFKRSAYVIYPGHNWKLGTKESIHFLGRNYKKILIIAPSSQIKGFEYSLKVFEKLSRDLSIEMTIVGDIHPLYSKLLISYIKKKKPGFERIKILGKIPTKELMHCIIQSNAVLYCSINEPFGIVPLESVSLGTPCIGFDMGGLKETMLTDELQQYLAKPNSIKDLIRITKNTLESEKRISTTSINKIRRKFSWKKTVDQYERLIDFIKEK